MQEGGILITTYDIVRNNYKAIRGGDKYQEHDLYDEEDEMIWDYVILDEGHIIKNPKTQRAQSLSEIPSGHRIIISGTPIQNNLKVRTSFFFELFSQRIMGTSIMVSALEYYHFAIWCSNCVGPNLRQYWNF